MTEYTHNGKRVTVRFEYTNEDGVKCALCHVEGDPTRKWQEIPLSELEPSQS